MDSIGLTITALGFIALAFIPLTVAADFIHARTVGGDQ